MKKISIYAVVLTALFTLHGLYTQAQTVNTTNVTSGAAFNVFGTDTVTVWGNLYNNGTITINSGGTLRLFGDSTVNAQTASTTGSGTVQYIGTRPAPYAKSATQYTTGPVSLYNVLVNDSNGSKFNGTVTISNSLMLKKGMITADTVIVTNASASALSDYMADPSQSNYSKSGYINGVLKRAISSSGTYDFPVGTSSNYELMTIVPSSLTGTSYISAGYVSTNGSCSTPNPDSCKIGTTPVNTLLGSAYWTATPDIEPTGGTYAVYINERGYSNAPGAATQMCVIKRETCSDNWKSIGTHNDQTQSMNNSTAHAERSGLTSFSEYGIGWGDSPLPVQLESFDATAMSNTYVHTDWDAASQHNNRYFNVQRSANGMEFNTIATLDGCGTCTNDMHYAYNDMHPLQGTSYYRLQLVNSNNAYTYSTVQPVQIGDGSTMTLTAYPNPVNGILHVILPADLNGSVLSVKNILGQEQQNITLNHATDINVDMSSLPAGIYFIQLHNNNAEYVTKVVKQ